jgi:Na+/proline symporter
MIVGLIVLPVVALVQAGGFEQVAALLPRAHLSFSAVGAGAVIGFLGIGLGSPGQPHVVVRYMSIKDERQLVSAALIGTFWNVALGLGAVAIGLLGRALIPDVAGLPHRDPEMVYLVLSARYFDPIWYGFLMGGIFAAILSTADSQLLVVASTVVRDIREKMLGGEHMDERARLRLSRTAVVLSGLLAMVLALAADDLVFWLVLFAWGGLGASLGPALIASLYWRRTSRAGVLAGMIAGTSVTIAWKLLLKDATGVYELIPAFGAAVFCIVVFSLWRPDPDL